MEAQPLDASTKVYALPALLDQLRSWRASGQRIAFTNGCFDLMHLGHVSYLEAVRNCADRLVLGLNTDASVQRLKGPTRPIVDQRARARVAAALQAVDAVVLFDEDTPAHLIEQLRPDILAKGADYQMHEIVGADFVRQSGGEVHRIPLVEGYSTSALVRKIQRA